MARHVALLRGINVGGKNKVPMADLRAAFEDAGYEDVATYINSGNVVFDGPTKVAEDEVESMLETRLGLPLVVVLRSRQRFRNVLQKAPPGFGSQPTKHHSDVVFLKAPLTSSQVMKVVELREDVDEAWAGNGVVYFQRLSSQRTKSKMNSITQTSEYAQMTIRSWSTTTALLELLEEG
jgi:uncharacterized protein (DUF1697 family)